MDQEKLSSTVDTVSNCDEPLIKNTVENNTDDSSIINASHHENHENNITVKSCDNVKASSDNHLCSNSNTTKCVLSDVTPVINESECLHTNNKTLTSDDNEEKETKNTSCENVNQDILSDAKQSSNTLESTHLDNDDSECNLMNEGNEVVENEKCDREEKNKESSTCMNNETGEINNKNVDVDENSEKIMDVEMKRPEILPECDDLAEHTSSVEDREIAPDEISSNTDLDQSDELSLNKDKTTEPDKTEFVQILQDKHDESQIEGQSIEAEDPFGGDNITADTVDNIEIDGINDSNISFCKIPGDNLQQAIEAKLSNNEQKTSHENDSEINQSKELTSELDGNTEQSAAIKIINDNSKDKNDDVGDNDIDNQTNDDNKLEKNLEENSQSDGKISGNSSSNNNADNNKETKNKDETDVISTTEEQSTVLPGQDDELCIIPDDMKVVLPQRSKFNRIKVKDATEITADLTNNKMNDTNSSSGSSEKTGNSSANTLDITEKNTKTNTDDNDATASHHDDKISNVAESTNTTITSTESTTTSTASTTTSTTVSTITSSSTKVTGSIIEIDDELRNTEDIQEIKDTGTKVCKQCKKTGVSVNKFNVKIGNELYGVCSFTCKTSFEAAHNKAIDIPSDTTNSRYEKRCANCLLIVESIDDRNLSWETMEFCNEECLGKFQTKYGSYCRNCNGNVAAISLGKYCVRFGYDVRQFCCSTCLEEFKKGLKVCSYCQKDISTGTDGFLAPVGDKGQFKDFCTQLCMEKYARMNSTEPPISEKKACSVCQEEKIVYCEVQVDRSAPVAVCSEPCFAAFKFVNKVDPDQCSTCKKYFDQINKTRTVVFFNNEAHNFCSKTCLNIFIITHRKIVPCNWCKVKKYNFDMIKKELKNGQVITMCSLNCLTLYQVSMNAVSARRINCNFCKEYSQAQYHLTMSDATIRNFCSYDCVMKFQSQYTKSPITIPPGTDDTGTTAPVPTGTPKPVYPGQKLQTYSIKKTVDVQNLPTITSIAGKKTLPVISSVTSLASSNGQTVSINAAQKSTSTVTVAVNNTSITNSAPTQQQQQIIYKQQVITRPPSPVKIHNKMVQCKPIMHTKGVSVKPHPCTKSTQTDNDTDYTPNKIPIPIPVPIYIPFPVHMWNFPFPVPVPVALPIPVPIFIPTTRNSAKNIFKDIKRIQEKMPADPFEAELLMMAEMVATEKKPSEAADGDSNSSSNFENGDNEDNDDENDENDHEDGEENNINNNTETAVDSNNTFGDDMLQMALKMATGEIDEPAVDLEAALTPNTITASQAIQPSSLRDNGGIQSGETTDNGSGSSNDATKISSTTLTSTSTPSTRCGRKRTISYKSRGGPTKRGRRGNSINEVTTPISTTESQTQSQITEPVEKPDANMALKYTFGVNAWRKWVVAKNVELEKQSTTSNNRKVKLFKTDLLQLTADELNYSLCLFVKEVRKPNGTEYAPDTIYYLCLGIQQYLFENNRIDNIFTDTYYEQFTDCLNDVAKKFSVLYNEAQYIVTRVEEEHLWECKQLGAHSPHVLLSTLMFFNTKHFNLTTVEEHMQLSFSHIMKHWKRNPAAQTTIPTGKSPGSRNVLLRFYPPQSALDANSKKKKVYEQQENEDNPLRCPVKLYEFYLSKCPESVKTRNDVFYLLPERSCVPDSPVWYSTSPLGKEHLIKMLNRVKMVKEINIALLST